MTVRYFYSLLLIAGLVANLATSGLVAAAMAVELPTATAVAEEQPCHVQNQPVTDTDHSCHHDCLDCLFSNLIDSGNPSPLVHSSPALKFADHPAAFSPHDPEHSNPPPITSLT